MDEWFASVMGEWNDDFISRIKKGESQGNFFFFFWVTFLKNEGYFLFKSSLFAAD
jgi:hypothetical protein